MRGKPCNTNICLVKLIHLPQLSYDFFACRLCFGPGPERRLRPCFYGVDVSVGVIEFHLCGGETRPCSRTHLIKDDTMNVMTLGIKRWGRREKKDGWMILSDGQDPRCWKPPGQSSGWMETECPCCRRDVRERLGTQGAITSKIKHATKLKTSPARLAQLLQPSLAFCFSLQPMMAAS